MNYQRHGRCISYSTVCLPRRLRLTSKARFLRQILNGGAHDKRGAADLTSKTYLVTFLQPIVVNNYASNNPPEKWTLRGLNKHSRVSKRRTISQAALGFCAPVPKLPIRRTLKADSQPTWPPQLDVEVLPIRGPLCCTIFSPTIVTH